MQTTACLLVILVFLSAAPSLAQPAISIGHQLLSISFEECLSRASQAFTAEGFRITGKDAGWTSAGKEIHNSYIACDSAPDGKMWVVIFVASTAPDGGVPGLQRVRLQGRMDQSIDRGTPQPPKPVNPTCNTVVGRWQWFDGGVVSIEPNYRQSSNRGGSGSWQVLSGRTVKLHWDTFNSDDTLTLSPDGNTLSGTYNGQQAVSQRLDACGGSAAPAAGRNACGVWSWFNGAVVTLHPDQVVSSDSGGRGQWQIQRDGRLWLHWDTYNSDDFLTLSADYNTLTGTYNGAQARSARRGPCSRR